MALGLALQWPRLLSEESARSCQRDYRSIGNDLYSARVAQGGIKSVFSRWPVSNLHMVCDLTASRTAPFCVWPCCSPFVATPVSLGIVQCCVRYRTVLRMRPARRSQWCGLSFTPCVRRPACAKIKPAPRSGANDADPCRGSLVCLGITLWWQHVARCRAAHYCPIAVLVPGLSSVHFPVHGNAVAGLCTLDRTRIEPAVSDTKGSRAHRTIRGQRSRHPHLQRQAKRRPRTRTIGHPQRSLMPNECPLKE